MSTRVTIAPVTPPLPAVALDLTGDETIAGGVGGWETLDRPRNAPAVAWVGTPPTTLTIPAMVNGLEAAGVGLHNSVETECQRIGSWGLPHPATGEPPVLAVHGLTRVSSAGRWVVQDLSWGEYAVDQQVGGGRVQQHLTLTLQLWIAPAIVRGPAATVRAAGVAGGTGFTLTHVVGKAGKKKRKK